jgi:DedD protein
MGWFSKFRISSAAASASNLPAPDADSVQEARIRSRRRLIGAVVLVVIGVIGFPLIFETQPRPIPVDIPIEIPRKDGLPPLAVPSARAVAPNAAQAPVLAAPSAAASAPVTAAVTAPAAKPTAAPVEEVIAPGKPPVAVSSLPVIVAPAKLPATTASAVAPSLTVKPPAKPTAPTESARATALLEGIAPAATASVSQESARFVVQVGAFAENSSARETRLKVEKLGLKTYVQVAETPAGKRIRVRVGPYASKEEAEQAKTKLKAGGFPADLLTL